MIAEYWFSCCLAYDLPDISGTCICYTISPVELSGGVKCRSSIFGCDCESAADSSFGVSFGTMFIP